MVTNDGRNNIIWVATIIAFAALIISFIFTFVGNMERASDSVIGKVDVISGKVDRGIINITDSNAVTSDAVYNLTTAVNQLVKIFLEEREINSQNFAIFLSAQKNNTALMVDTINQMSRDNNVTRENQTNHFVGAINQMIDTSKQGQNLTKERIEMETLTNNKLDNLTETILNLTLVPTNLTSTVGGMGQ